MKVGVKSFWRVAALALGSLAAVATAEAAPGADRVLADAKAEAAAEHKTIFLTFQASWCEPCHQLDAFMHEPEIGSILKKYFVFASLNVAEEGGKHPELQSPGAEILLLKWGGMSGNAASIPYMVMLSEKAQPIINSNRPLRGKQHNEGIGYPAAPEEIAWFMVMLKKGAPAMTEEESRKIASRLQELAGN
jgi:thiol-disulfide isomerase/thioredoxin